MSDHSQSHSLHNASGPANSHGQPDGPQGGKRPLSGRKAAFWLVVLLIVAVAVAVAGIIPRKHAEQQLAASTLAAAIPDVQVARPTVGKPNQEVVVPGNIYAYKDSPIYARTTGYLTKWYFDIGAHVREGQLLGVIASPEVDQELAQAKADLATAQANAHNAGIQAKRYQELLAQNAVATQDRDNYTTQQKATSTQVKSAQANVDRLEQLVGFEKVYAPFTGTVTARDVDIGTLIDAGTTHELFHMADEHILRVYVNVPEVYSAACVPGVMANLTFNEFPDRVFPAKIVRTAKAIDPASRTLLVEIDVDNRKGELYPGMYTEVHLSLNVDHPTLILPVSTLMFRQEGLRVVTVKDNIAHLTPIKIGQDDGRVVQVVDGLTADDEVLQNPPDSIVEGERVHVLPTPGGQQPQLPEGDTGSHNTVGSHAQPRKSQQHGGE